MKTNDDDVWRSQIANSIKNMHQLKDKLKLTEKENITNISNLPVKITNYYLELIKKYPELRRTVVPTIYEQEVNDIEYEDPLDEDEYKKTDCIIHKYQNRVLFLCTSQCSSYCRYCTRSRMVDKKSFKKEQWDDAISYIKNNKQIQDVLISGGDPMILSNKKLDYILGELKKIDHVGIIRIGTKMPVVLPSRINQSLIDILKIYAPIYINIHFTRKEELTKECIEACKKLRDVGCILGSQTVLLKGINDDPNILKELFYELLKNGIRPYYLYQMDKIKGGSHFRCDLDTMINIMKQLIGLNSGLAIPEFIIDTEIGKIPLRLDYVTRNDEGKYILTNFEKNVSIIY